MSDELFKARKGGSASEVDDLLVMIGGLQQGLSTPTVRAAANRQAQRRFKRTNLRHDVDHSNTNRKPVIGDRVEDPSGDQWVVTEVEAGSCKGIASNGLSVRCAPNMLTIVVPVGHCQVIEQVITPAAHPALCALHKGQKEAEERLYNGMWDLLDTHTFDPELRVAVEGVLRRYEEKMAALEAVA